MIHDGATPIVPWQLKMDGWRHPAALRIATPDLVDLDAGIDVTVDPAVIDVLTKSGLKVRVVYDARGDYVDRWVSVSSGRVIRDMCWWRPV